MCLPNLPKYLPPEAPTSLSDLPGTHLSTLSLCTIALFRFKWGREEEASTNCSGPIPAENQEEEGPCHCSHWIALFSMLTRPPRTALRGHDGRAHPGFLD